MVNLSYKTIYFSSTLFYTTIHTLFQVMGKADHSIENPARLAQKDITKYIDIDNYKTASAKEYNLIAIDSHLTESRIGVETSNHSPSSVTVSIFSALSEILSQTTESFNDLVSSTDISTSTLSSSTTTTSTTTTTTTTTTTPKPIITSKKKSLDQVQESSTIENSYENTIGSEGIDLYENTDKNLVNNPDITTTVSNEVEITKNTEETNVVTTLAPFIVYPESYSLNSPLVDNLVIPITTQTNTLSTTEETVTMMTETNSEEAFNNTTFASDTVTRAFENNTAKKAFTNNVETTTEPIQDVTFTTVITSSPMTVSTLQVNTTLPLELIPTTPQITKSTTTTSTTTTTKPTTTSEYTPRFSKRLPVLPIGSTRKDIPSTLGHTITTTIRPKPTRRAEFVVYGILPNNTVIKRIIEQEPDIDNVLIVYGVFPNGTLVRRYPNGTTVPDRRERIEITNIDPKSLEDPNSDIYKESYSELTTNSHATTSKTDSQINNNLFSNSSLNDTIMVLTFMFLYIFNIIF